MVKCLICGKECGQMQTHLKYKHNLTAIEYRSLFADAQFISKEITEKRVKNTLWYYESELHKNRFSKISLDPENLKKRSLHISRTIRSNGKLLEFRYKQLCATNKTFGKIPHKYLSKNEKLIHFRSKWERTFALLLDNLGLEYEYENSFIRLPDEHHYFPDFYIKNLDLYIEIKGFAKYWDYVMYVKEFMDKNYRYLFVDRSVYDKCELHRYLNQDSFSAIVIAPYVKELFSCYRKSC